MTEVRTNMSAIPVHVRGLSSSVKKLDIVDCFFSFNNKIPIWSSSTS